MHICSVSTIPGRLSSLLIVLERLKNQTKKPDKLLITVAKYYPRLKMEYPPGDLKNLEQYLSTYPIENHIIKAEVDVGPTMKLTVPLQYLSSLETTHNNQSDDVIIIFDDDSVFYEKGVELLVNAYQQDPNAVYGIMGVIENQDPTKTLFLHGEAVSHGYVNVDLLGGYRGVLYPLKLLQRKDSADEKLDLETWVNMFIEPHRSRDLIAMHDDHIFAYYCAYRGIPKRVIHIPGAKGKLFYEPIGNSDGIFADKNSDTSYKMIKEIASPYIS